MTEEHVNVNELSSLPQQIATAHVPKLARKRRRDSSSPRRKYTRYSFPPGTTFQEKRRAWNKTYEESKPLEYRLRRAERQRKKYHDGGVKLKKAKAELQRKYYHNVGEEKKKLLKEEWKEKYRNKWNKMTEEERKELREKNTLSKRINRKKRKLIGQSKQSVNQSSMKSIHLLLTLFELVLMTGGVSATSGKALIDLNVTPPASPQGEAGDSSATSSNQGSPDETDHRENTPQARIDYHQGRIEYHQGRVEYHQNKMSRVESKMRYKAGDVQFKKVGKDDKRTKYSFPPGTTYREKKRVWRREQLKRDRQNPEKRKQIATYHRNRSKNLTEAEKQNRREQQRKWYHSLSLEEKQRKISKVAASNKRRRENLPESGSRGTQQR
ncbi:uncharacterized protein FA14DRAFT_185267 [Meira miltonrushii]|uniref:Uncharacterized protein n=1 Tax=Meira miltonrushii TaxID=1280837 RepID=A0A316VDJ0_9BASI|nr:uncharacterized protein FA14DRAFT_185267 [Meira miltonrushii]PWN33555.1 hypothetical protein FA14DRAFT_185267 [Meira miltonrushii]